MLYEIRVRGHLGSEWSSWLDGLQIKNMEQGEAVLSGRIPDQAALHGVLMRIRDLGLPLLSVNRIAAGRSHTAEGSERPEGRGDGALRQARRSDT